MTDRKTKKKKKNETNEKIKIKIINGPNLNMLGIREPDIYGKETYKDLCKKAEEYAKEKCIDLKIVQSNSEGVLVDEIQDCYKNYNGIIINPAAYTHTSVAILDAVKAVGIPTVEVHLSDISKREDFRQKSFIRAACVKTIFGKGANGYLEALSFLQQLLSYENGKNK